MLKACCECLTGSLLNGPNSEGSYGTQLNGGSESVPLRPVRSTEQNMFLIPTRLNSGDNLEVSWTFINSNRFTINLLTGSPNPDYSNIACQIDSDLSLSIKENGQSEEIKAGSPGQINGTDVKFRFKFEENYGSNTLFIFVNGSHLDMVELRHDISQITFLEVTGDVKVTELAFKFA